MPPARLSRCRFRSVAFAVALALAPLVPLEASFRGEVSARADSHPFLVTQLPLRRDLEAQGSRAKGMQRANYGDGARIVLVLPDGTRRLLSEGFAGATDPDISFDGTKVVFAGKRVASDDWNIYEIGIDGSRLRQITRDLGDCGHPVYLSSLYTIVSPEPWYQIAFTRSEAGELNEAGAGEATHLYTCRLDGTEVRRVTFNLSSDLDPHLMPDGRLLYSAWQRSTLRRGRLGRIALFAVNSDGTDVSIFSADEGRRIKHMACATTRGFVVFVEAEQLPWDGGGRLASVSLRRPLHSYRSLTGPADGVFAWPSALPDGRILVSRRAADGSSNYGVVRLDPETGETTAVFDDPDYHDIQARMVTARPEPDGRSSVVTEKDPYGRLYCLNVAISDLPQRHWVDPSVSRLRVVEGLPLSSTPSAQDCEGQTPPLAPRRILGEIPLEPDGSFFIKVPANTPIELQVLDEKGMALRACSWIWAKNHEPRGCIGCHEDPELAPENRWIDAVKRPPVELTLPPERRRRVGFRRDVLPIIQDKCSVKGCHAMGGAKPYLGRGEDPCTSAAYRNLVSSPGGYVDPGKARTSPLIWLLFGRNTSRPWDPSEGGTPRPVRHPDGPPLTEDELRTFVEWIDLGAHWE